MSFVNFKKISTKNERDHEIIERDIELEQAAIDEYQGQLADASSELRKVLEHLIMEEQEHRRELEELYHKGVSHEY